jgi:hypothetical protein
MFIFERPVQAVVAGLAVAFLTVGLDHLCHPPATAVDDAPAAGTTLAACARLVPSRPHAVSSAPVRDLSLSCRLPPA